MTIQNRFKQTAIFSASALALAVASASHAVDFEVGDTTASVYGYAKLDIIYDVDNKLGNSVGRGAARLDGVDGSDGHTTMHAYQSRIGFSTATPVAGSNLETTIEGDFYGSGGGEFRLRHAYGEWNGILAGQTWTNFTGFVAGTPTVDFTGPGGLPLVHRQAQLRYTTGNFSMALEDPDDKGGAEDALGNKSQLPDVTFRYTDRSGPVKYSASAVARYLEYDNADFVTPSSDDSTLGWGLGFEAAMDVTETLTLRAGLAHGEGIGGYINGNPMVSPAYVDADGNLEAIEATGGLLGASLKAGPGAINVAYNLITADLDDNPAYASDGTVDNPGRNDEFEEVWVNYIWSPAERISYGIEASWHSRETTGDFEGDATRLQGMVMYSF